MSPNVGNLSRGEKHLLWRCTRSGFLIWRAVSTSTPLSLLCIQSIFAGQINENSLSIPVKIRLENKNIETLSLLDSGAGGEFIDQNYAKTLKLPLLNLERPIPVINVDGTLNKKGTIKQYINLDLEIFGQKQIIWLLVTELGKQKILLGFPWLQKYNPIIDWQTGSFHWWHIPRKFNFRKRIKSLSTKSSSPSGKCTLSLGSPRAVQDGLET